MYVYFINVSTPAEIKSLYRKLAMEHHPDRGGDTRVMQDINSEYHDILKSMHGHTTRGSDGKDHTYYYNYWREDMVTKVLKQLFALNLPDDVEIDVIGTWVWVSGNTKPIKDKLKSIDRMRFNSRRKCWQWSPPGSHSVASNLSKQELQWIYGGKKVSKPPHEEEEQKPKQKELT